MKPADTVRNLASMLCVVGLGAVSACSPPDALAPPGPPTPGPGTATLPATASSSSGSAATTTDCRSDGTGTSCTPCSYPGLATLLPHDTDPQLGMSATDGGTYGTNPSAPHCYGNPKSTSNNLLFLFLPGSFAVPTQYQMILYQARALGYHVLSLSYANAATNGPAPISEPDPTKICGDRTLSAQQLLDCWGDLRANRFNGAPETTLPAGKDPYVSPSPKVNSVEHRVKQALLYLAQQDSEWAQFLTPAKDNPLWPSIVVAGHSQGGGLAAFIASKVHVKGVVSFSEPNDATPLPLLIKQSTCASNPPRTTDPASWVGATATPPRRRPTGPSPGRRPRLHRRRHPRGVHVARPSG
jgi:hypothetical protein